MRKKEQKLKAMESQSSSLTTQLKDSHANVSQLEVPCSVLPNSLINTGKKNNLLNDLFKKAVKDLDVLQKELSTCKAEKDNILGKLKMVHTELESAKATIKRMNTGSMKLDEILGGQKSDLPKTSIGYEVIYTELQYLKIKVNLFSFKDPLCTR